MVGADDDEDDDAENVSVGLMLCPERDDDAAADFGCGAFVYGVEHEQGDVWVLEADGVDPHDWHVVVAVSEQLPQKVVKVCLIC